MFSIVYSRRKKKKGFSRVLIFANQSYQKYFAGTNFREFGSKNAKFAKFAKISTPKVCKIKVRQNAHALLCETCLKWHHQRCMKMSPIEYQHWKVNEKKWYCKTCLGTTNHQMPNIEWGDLGGFHEIQKTVMDAYAEIVTWQKNFFEPPKGNAGNDCKPHQEIQQQNKLGTTRFASTKHIYSDDASKAISKIKEKGSSEISFKTNSIMERWKN